MKVRTEENKKGKEEDKSQRQRLRRNPITYGQNTKKTKKMSDDCFYI